MSLINPVSPKENTGDHVTARARPRPVREWLPRKGGLTYRGAQPTNMPEQIVGSIALIQGLQAELLHRLEALGDTQALWSGTKVISANLDAFVDIDAGYRSVHVANLGTHAMTVIAGPANDPVNPQQQGPGVFPLGAGHFLTMPALGSRLTVIGTAGDLARLALYGVTLPAAAGAV